MERVEQIARLTEREKVCLRQWLQNKSAKEIAVDLGITHHAVEKRLKMARAKLGATSSLEAARILSDAEGYGRAVAHTPDLTPHPLTIQKAFLQKSILGGIVMTLFAAALLALFLQPSSETSTPAQTSRLVDEYDEQLDVFLAAMIDSSEVGPDGEVFLTYPLGDGRFLRPNSGYYWQVSAEGRDDFTSPSLSDRRLKVRAQKAVEEIVHYDSTQFPNEPLRVAERTVALPNSSIEWHFIVARLRNELN